MIEVVHQVRGSPRINTRRILLAYLALEYVPRGLYRTLEYPHLRYPKKRYPKPKDFTSLLAQAGPPVTPTIVPNVVGLPLAVGVSAITVLGLTAQVTSITSATVVAGIIVYQSPAAGSQVQTGITIAITVSLGSGAGFRVQAVSAGFYNNDYKDIGDVFDIASAGDFSDSTLAQENTDNPDYPTFGWMVQVPSTTPLFSWASSGISSPRLSPRRVVE